MKALVIMLIVRYWDHMPRRVRLWAFMNDTDELGAEDLWWSRSNWS